ncbi:transcription factor iiib 90 kda subunit [Plakobranchus ocellatus]|uniref:Transcription factor iiib 90 kDa subunit n=1 Tax=Plakobranchus ocellatus TaxID=259542 RepID=A0AAV4BUT8_9GAST|nr:transcription factor iiib 90 kda subunit [Plakobranchus ocellatus]
MAKTLVSREEALRNRHIRDAERLSANTSVLPPLITGDCVRIQNQTGPHPTKWDKTGIVIEVRQFDQYVVRVDGSGGVTLTNRKFLRKYLPVIPRAPLAMAPKLKVSMPTQMNKSSPGGIQTPTRLPQPDDQKFNKPLPMEECLREPDLSLDDTNLTPTMDPDQTGDSTPHSLASPKDNRATHPELRALRALKPFTKPGLKEALFPPTTRRITHSQKGSTETRES